MRIWFAVHRFPPASWGGTELYTLRLAQAVQARGHEVRVLTYEPGATEAATSRMDRFAELDVVRLSFDLARTANPIQEEYDNPRVAQALRALWDGARPDLLHATHLGYLSTSILALAQEMGIPYVVTLTDMWALCPNGLLLRGDGRLCRGPEDRGECLRCYAQMGPRGMRYRFIRAIPPWAGRGAIALAQKTALGRWRYGRWLRALDERQRVIRQRLQGAEALISPGAFLRGLLVRHGYPEERILLSPHGIAAPQTLRRPGPVGAEPRLRFGYIGPLEPHKGAHLPLEAFALLAPGVATLAYWGPRPAEHMATPYARRILRRLTRTPGAHHQGSFTPEKAPAILASMDVLIVPSLCYENTPTVIYEALASGTPVIASDQGGMRELVQTYRGGWLFPRGDARALARLMAQLAADRESLRRAAEAILPVPDFAAHVDQVSRLYQDVRFRRAKL